MKLFYHFLVLVAASLILFACGSLFTSSHQEKKVNKPSGRSGNNLNNDDTLFDSEVNTRFIFSNLYNKNFLGKYNYNNKGQEHNRYKNNNPGLALN